VTDGIPRRRTGFADWSLRQRAGRASLALLVVLALVFTAVIISLADFSAKGNEVINRWQPAYSVSESLLADMVNQETGIRGYALGRSDSFLQPYRDYLSAEGRHEKALIGLIGGRGDLRAAFAKFRAEANAWHSAIAVPYIARVRAHDPSVADAATSGRAKAAFDRIRVAASALITRIGAVRDQAKRDRITSIRFVWAAFIVSALLVLLAGTIVWRGLRKTVLDPVDDLARQTREVAGGAIDKRILESGPPEIAGLGRDVDTMREQIASELARVEAARAVLAERGEELARSNADLEQFAYVASHDLSEPLRKVANFCQLLERQYSDQLDDKAKQYIAFAVDGAKRMQVLIADLLAFSRVGRTTDTFEKVDTERSLDRALATLEDRIIAGRAEIVRGPLPTLTGDPTLLTALFQNLVGNSLKYHDPERTPRIEINAEEQDEQWLFTVADNGIGIDPQYSERIFTIFQRLHLRDQYGGTGIGLALCRKIVEFHRGKIWLGDSAGPGATFHFLIPRQLHLRSDLPTDLRDTVDANEH
jgi:hypothetical protein